MADVLMYDNDAMLCYGITADELKQAYSEKIREEYETLVNSNMSNSYTGAGVMGLLRQFLNLL